MRPVIRALERARGARCDVTARDFAQTLGLAERFGHRARGDRPPPRRPPRGQGRSGCCRARRRWRAGRAGRRLRPRARPRLQRRHASPRGCCGIPRATAFDYEWATRAAHDQLPAGAGRRRARRDPARAARAATARRRRSCSATRASRRSTTWRTSSPTRRCSTSSGSTARAPLAVVRTPPAVSLYHRFENPLFGAGARAPARAGARSSCCRARPSSAPSWRAPAASSSPSTRSTRQSLSPSPTS